MRRAVAMYLGLLALVGLPRLVVAQDAVADFYRGKQITLLAASAPGSGSVPLYTQTLARHIGRHIPGNPSMIVQFMPGASGLVGANYLYNHAPRDGTWFAHSPRNVMLEPLLQNSNAQYDPRRFGWLGTTNIENLICMSWHTSSVKTLHDAMMRESTVGSSAQDAGQSLWPKAANKLIDTKFKVINAYATAPSIMLAMERGELDTFCGIGWTYMKLRKTDWVIGKKINILFQIASQKHPDLPDVPLMGDFIRTPGDRQLYDFLLGPQQFGRPFYTPPDVPPDRLAALQRAFKATLEDPAFLADAEKAGLEIQYAGPEVAKVVEALYATPKDVIARAKALGD